MTPDRDGTLVTEALTADQLVAELDRLGVWFLSHTALPVPATPPAPAELLAGLAASDDARLRLALIPLLLAHPRYAANLPAALQGLSASAQTVLRCYATAAVLLQRQFAPRLRAIFGPQPRLQDWFSTELGIPPENPVDEQLANLAVCQRQLSGRKLNWEGTYRHGAEHFLDSMERQRQWAETSIKS